jgi:uncharacterized protein YqfB (UPF0267 family)
MNKHHVLKIHPEYYKEVASGNKTFEIRDNSDRHFKVGDTICLQEYDKGEFLPSKSIWATITYITNYAQYPQYVVFSFKRMLP